MVGHLAGHTADHMAGHMSGHMAGHVAGHNMAGHKAGNMAGHGWPYGRPNGQPFGRPFGRPPLRFQGGLKNVKLALFSCVAKRLYSECQAVHEQHPHGGLMNLKTDSESNATRQ